MPNFTTPHQIQYPLAADSVKATGDPSKLASDMKAIAVTAAIAVSREGARVQAAASSDASLKVLSVKDDAVAESSAYTDTQTADLQADVDATQAAQDGRLALLEAAAGFPAPPLGFQDGVVAALLADGASETTAASETIALRVAEPITRVQRAALADKIASWMGQELTNELGDIMPVSMVRRLRLRKPTAAQPYVSSIDITGEEGNTTSMGLALQFLALYAEQYPDRQRNVRPLVDHLAGWLLGMQVNNPRVARHGGYRLGPGDASCGTLSTAQAGRGMMLAYKVFGVGKWMESAKLAAKFIQTVINPNPVYMSLYGVNVIAPGAGAAIICDRIGGTDVINVNSTAWCLKGAQFLYELTDVTGDPTYRAAALPVRDFMATTLTGYYDFYATTPAADGKAAGFTNSLWQIQPLSLEDNQFHRAGDAVADKPNTIESDSMEYSLSALYAMGYDIAPLKVAYEFLSDLTASPDAGSSEWQAGYNGRICWPGYFRPFSPRYDGASHAFGSYYDSQGAGEILKFKHDQYPADYLLSLQIINKIVEPDRIAMLDVDFNTIWVADAETGGVSGTQGVIPIAVAGIGLMETAALYNLEVIS